jgi:hypothetical protein
MIVQNMEEIKGDVKTILVKLEYLTSNQKDQEGRIRTLECESTTSRTKLGSILAVASIIGGVITTLLGVLLQYFV